MFTLLLILAIFISLLLMAVVLMQSSKGGGLAGTFGGPGEMGAIFGVRRTADFLMKTTWVLAVTLMLLAIVINLVALPSSSQEKNERKYYPEEKDFSLCLKDRHYHQLNLNRTNKFYLLYKN